MAYLPVQLSSFIGREGEIALVRDLLGANRLLTLTGPGGVGKTRLALAAARQVTEQFPDGILFVSLAPVTDTAIVPATIASALDVTPVSNQSPLDALAEHLASRRTLLLLDNFEHIVEAAPLIVDLLTTCPALSVMVTSRTPLHLSGEQELPVPPLTLPCPHPLPPLEKLAQCEAVALFVQRARASIMNKLGVDSRTAAATWALKQGIT